MIWVEFFSTRLPHIFLIYGLAFFALGLAVALEIGRSEPTRFSRAMLPLAFFGLIHGSHEWMEMFTIIGQDAYSFEPALWFEVVRLLVLAISFSALTVFGAQILRPPQQAKYPNLYISLGMLLLYSFGVAVLGWWLNWQQSTWFAAADVLARYMLAIPGAILTAGAFWWLRQDFLRQKQIGFAKDLLWVALAFLLYGVVGQLFVGPSPLFPSNVLNPQTFLDWFGIPVQVFRATMAVTAAIFTIRALRSFEFSRQQELALARRQVEEEIARRDALRQEFLQRTVEMQEEERTRIARELHDQLGQALTGLAIGLRGTQLSIDQPDMLRQQLGQLEEMAVQALGDMRRLITELRPAILDDMGLSVALRHYCKNFARLADIKITLSICDSHLRLPGSAETVFFRITQEALTNIARHAEATQVTIDLCCCPSCAELQITDNGLGFDQETIANGKTPPGWGLMGIQERVRLINGEVEIQSEMGKGTSLFVRIPLVEGASLSKISCLAKRGEVKNVTYQITPG